MTVQISEQLLSRNRPGTPLTPRGIVIHSTACPGATAQNIRDSFNRPDSAKASAHYAVDWNGAIRMIPDSEMAWHAGPTANRQYLSVELCETDDPVKFDAAWRNLIDLVTYICRRYGWDTGPIWSHRGISQAYHDTDHTDPIGYLASYGKTWDDLLADIESELKGGNTVDEGILIFGPADFEPAIRLAATLGNEVAIFVRKPDGTPPVAIKQVKHLYVVGGSQEGVGHPNETVLAGPNWFATVAAVAKKLGY